HTRSKRDWSSDVCSSDLYVGVYSLTNSQTNTVYVGSTTKSFNERWRRHIRDLQLNSHSCKYLQNSFNKYGCYSFSFSVLAQWEFDDASEIKIRNEENRQWNLLKSTGRSEERRVGRGGSNVWTTRG